MSSGGFNVSLKKEKIIQKVIREGSLKGVRMKLLDKISVSHASGEKCVELYHGDLTELSLDEAVDVLVVSAFPDHYDPTPGSLIHALHHKGVSLEELAKHKEADLRSAFSCWMSREISSPHTGIRFNRILCFEPSSRGHPAELVGDIFQSLMPFVHADPPIESLAMPLVASGYQGVALDEMLEPLLDAAVHWLALGLPVKCLKIVECSELKAAELKGAFSVLKKRYSDSIIQSTPQQFKYDLFIQYLRH